MIQAIEAAIEFERQMRFVGPTTRWPRDPLLRQLAIDFALIDAEVRNGMYIGADGHWHARTVKRT